MVTASHPVEDATWKRPEEDPKQNILRLMWGMPGVTPGRAGGRVYTEGHVEVQERIRHNGSLSSQSHSLNDMFLLLLLHTLY